MAYPCSTRHCTDTCWSVQSLPDLRDSQPVLSLQRLFALWLRNDCEHGFMRVLSLNPIVLTPERSSDSPRSLFSSVQFSCSVMSDSLRPHESQHTRPPCPSPSPGVHSNSCPSSQWCHPAISFSVVPFSSCPQSLPASKSFPMSQLFALDWNFYDFVLRIFFLKRSPWYWWLTGFRTHWPHPFFFSKEGTCLK